MRVRLQLRTLLPVLATVALLLLFSMTALGQCSMCRSSLAGSNNAFFIRNFNIGVLCCSSASDNILFDLCSAETLQGGGPRRTAGGSHVLRRRDHRRPGSSGRSNTGDQALVIPEPR